jgi:hypothetical protein
MGIGTALHGPTKESVMAVIENPLKVNEVMAEVELQRDQQERNRHE